MVAFEQRLVDRDEDVVVQQNTLGQQAPLARAHAPVETDGGTGRFHDGVVADHQVFDLLVAIGFGIGDARGDRDGTLGAVIDVGDVVADDLVALADDAYAPRALLVLAQEGVVLDDGPVTVTQGKRAGAVAEGVAAENVVAGFVGDDLDLAVAPLKEVVLDGDVGGGVALFAGAQPHGLEAVAVFGVARAVQQVVVVDPVVGGYAVEPSDNGASRVVLAVEAAVIHAVVGAVKGNPEVAGVDVFGVVVGQTRVGQPAVGRVTQGAAELDDVAQVAGCAVFEVQPVDHQVGTGDREVGRAGDRHAAGRFGAKGDGGMRGALSGKDDFLIAPHAVGHDQRVTGLCHGERFFECVGVGHRDICRRGGERDEGCHQQKSSSWEEQRHGQLAWGWGRWMRRRSQRGSCYSGSSARTDSAALTGGPPAASSESA